MISDVAGHIYMFPMIPTSQIIKRLEESGEVEDVGIAGYVIGTGN